MRRQVCGESDIKIKNDLQIKDTHFSVIINSELFIEEKNKMESAIHAGLVKKLGEERALDPVNTILQDACVEAAHANVAFMKTGSEHVRQKSVWDILNRRGYTSAEKIDVQGDINLNKVAAGHVEKALKDIQNVQSKE